MDERLQFVARRLAGEPMAELCRDFGTSRKTGYIDSPSKCDFAIIGEEVNGRYYDA